MLERLGLASKTAPVAPPAQGGRSGVAGSETAQERFARSAFPNLHNKLDGIEMRLQDLARVKEYIQQLYLRPESQKIRENSHRVITFNTATGESVGNFYGDITAPEGAQIDVATLFGGLPANSVRCFAVGAGTLQWNVNAEGWLPVAIPNTDRLEDETIFSLRVRVVTPGAGTAIIRLGARVGEEKLAAPL